MTTIHQIGELLRSGVRPTEEETEDLKSLGGFVAEMYGRFMGGHAEHLTSAADLWSGGSRGGSRQRLGRVGSVDSGWLSCCSATSYSAFGDRPRGIVGRLRWAGHGRDGDGRPL